MTPRVGGKSRSILSLSRWLLGVLGLASGACQAQTGEGYTGEVMLTLRGHVEAAPDMADERVPALAFYGADQTLQIVDGQVRGVFPADFQLDVAAPPPAHAIYEGTALGRLVLVRRDHPKSIEYPLPDVSYPDGPPRGMGVPYRQHRSYCLKSGDCLERDFECVENPCEVFEESGPLVPEDAELEGDNYVETQCFGDVCYEVRVACQTLDSCQRSFARCENRLSCEPKGESGDRSVLAYADYPVIAQNLSIVYMTEQAASPERFQRAGIEPGYTLYASATKLTNQEWVDIASCRADARQQAWAEFNREHGTAFAPQSFGVSEADRAAISERELELTEPCPRSWVVNDPAATRLTLDLREPLDNGGLLGPNW
jgi:hypothetical protein